MSNIQIHKGNLLRYTGAASVFQDGSWKGLFPVRELGFTRGSDGSSPPCHGQKIQQI